MQAHRFTLGEAVLYTERRFPNLNWKASFRIIGLLPPDELEPRYRIRSADLTYDRAAGEHQLSRQPLPQEARRLLDGRPLAACVWSQDEEQKMASGG